MGAYALGLIPLLNHLQSIKQGVKYFDFIDHLTAAGKLVEIKIYWLKIQNMVTTQSHQSHSLL